MHQSGFLNSGLACLALAWVHSPASAQLRPETPGAVMKLPASYPDHWLFVHDLVDFQMLNERVILFDADDGRYVGQVNSALLAQFKVSRTRSELYVVETFYSRGTRGERTDVVTLYNKETLAPFGEIVLPGGKRMITPPEDYLAELTNDERFLLVVNFTPASSVTVVDLVNRKVVNEVPIAGCSMVYATGARGFSSLCSDGRMMTLLLDRAGQVSRSARSEPLFKVEEDPLFEKAAIVDGVAYFPSFKGRMLPIDLNGDTPVRRKSWSLLDEKDAASGYRPGGWQLIGQHARRHELYVLMHGKGFNGSHKDPGREVWVFDAQSKRRMRRITLREPATSLKVTSDDAPLLAVTGPDTEIDIYQASTGEFKRRITDMGITPSVFHVVRE